MGLKELTWSKQQARLYQLYCTGLHGKNYQAGPAGIAACFADLGSIQLDPLGVLGRNQDLVIQSRVPGTHPDDLLEVVHRRRLGFEYWDKMFCLIAIDDYPLFKCFMERPGDYWTERRAQELEKKLPGTLDAVHRAVKANGPISSRELAELEVAQQDHRGWKATKAANLALDALWNRGVLAISHRVNFRRYYDLTERVIPRKLLRRKVPDWQTFLRRALLRRIRTVGLLAERANADAWTMLRGARKEKMPDKLVEEGKLVKIQVQDAKSAYYAEADAAEKLARAEGLALDRRVRCIAPLDPLMWGRGTLADLWDFDYVWEVYKPAPQRRYGYYVLGLLQGTRFIGRFDGKCDRREGVLNVLSYQQETDGLPVDDPDVQKGFYYFRNYLRADSIRLPAKTKRSAKKRA